MAYVFFSDILNELGYKISYMAIVNLAGNAFAKDASKAIQEANPMIMTGESHGANDIANFLKNAKITRVKVNKSISEVRDGTWLGKEGTR